MTKGNWVLVIATLVATLVTSSCAAPEQVYIAADRATYEAIAPEYLAHVEASCPTLTAEQRARRCRTVEAWRLRIAAGEARHR